MQELIRIESCKFGDSEIAAVNARNLWEKLEVKSKFADWIIDKTSQAHLTEGSDYLVFLQKEKNLQGGRPSKEYVISLDSAKHIAMLEGNEKGKEIRQYFIDFEKKAKEALLAMIQKKSQDTEAMTKDLDLKRFANENLKLDMETAQIMKVPPSFVLSESVKRIKFELGIDYTHLLPMSEYMKNIPQEDRLLNPAALGRKIGKSAQLVNNFLAYHGYQKKDRGGEWNYTAIVPGGMVERRLWNGQGMRYHLVWNVDWFLIAWQEKGGHIMDLDAEAKALDLFRDV